MTSRKQIVIKMPLIVGESLKKYCAGAILHPGWQNVNCVGWEIQFSYGQLTFIRLPIIKITFIPPPFQSDTHNHLRRYKFGRGERELRTPKKDIFSSNIVIIIYSSTYNHMLCHPFLPNKRYFYRHGSCYEGERILHEQ